MRQGLSGGGLCYGYDIVPGKTGERRINELEAPVVKRIFEEFAAGHSPRAIAKNLNAEGISGPHGREWRDTTIRGHITRGTGVVNNELYVGRLVWNRLTYAKDPATGKRCSRPNPPESWIVEDVPDLRIIEDSLWGAAKARQNEIRSSDRVEKARATRFWEHRRTHHLLSGLVHCSKCGSRYASVGRDYLACSAARGRGTCDNRQGLRRSVLEGLIVNGLRSQLMAPELIEEFIQAFQQEINRHRRDQEAARTAKQRQLSDVTRKLDGLVNAIAEGLRGPSLQKQLDDLEGRKSEIETALRSPAPPVVRLHPNLGQVYRRKVEQLQKALDEPASKDEAIEILRSLIDRVVIGPGNDGLEIEIIGEIARMVELGLADGAKKSAALDERTACSVKVVAGAGFVQEPTITIRV